MLIPRFSLRWLLAAMSLCGVVAYVLGKAIAGQSWAIAISVVVGSLLLTASVYASVFIVAWSIAALSTRSRKLRTSSPFAMHVTPPQILPPQEPE